MFLLLETIRFLLKQEYKPPSLHNHNQLKQDKKKTLTNNDKKEIKTSDQSKKHLMKLMLTQIRDLKSQMREIEPSIQRDSRKKKQSRSSRSISESEESLDMYAKRRLDLLNKNPRPPAIWNQPPPYHPHAWHRPHNIGHSPQIHRHAPLQIPAPVPRHPISPQRLYQPTRPKASAFTPINNRVPEVSPMLYMTQGSPPVLFIASPPKHVDDDSSSCSSCSCSGR